MHRRSNAAAHCVPCIMKSSTRYLKNASMWFGSAAWTWRSHERQATIHAPWAVRSFNLPKGSQSGLTILLQAWTSSPGRSPAIRSLETVSAKFTSRLLRYQSCLVGGSSGTAISLYAQTPQPAQYRQPKFAAALWVQQSSSCMHSRCALVHAAGHAWASAKLIQIMFPEHARAKRKGDACMQRH